MQRRLALIDDELEMEGLNKKRIKALELENVNIIDEMKKNQEVKQQGWVLVDFPCSYPQAKLLEKALSGYEPEEELELTERQK